MTSPPSRLGRSSRDVSSWKVGRVALERRVVRALAARQSHPTALGKFLTSVKEHRLQLDEDVEVNDARVVYPNDCFVLDHGSQLLTAVMDRWLSFSRFGPIRLPRNFPHLTVFLLIVRLTHMRPPGAVDFGVGREMKGGSRGLAVAGSGEVRRARVARPLRESSGWKHNFLSAALGLLVRFP